MRRDPPLVLLISGLDQTGGAGLLADIRGLSASGVRIAPVVSALTAQGAAGVTLIHSVSPEMIAEQCRYLAEEYEISAVKTFLANTGSNSQRHPENPLSSGFWEEQF